jgi:hypothetical protein
MSDSMLRIAFGLSAALHGAFGMWVEVRGVARPPPIREVADSWIGPGIEVDAVPNVPPVDPAAARESEEAPGASAREAATPAIDHESAPAGVVAPPRRAPKVSEVASAPAIARAVVPNVRKPSAASAENPTTAGSSSAASTSAFGAAGLPNGVRHLPKAFTRALGIASRGDPRWLALPLGPVAEAHIELSVDEDGRLGELAFSDREEREHLAPVVRHLLENTVLLLANGRFSLDPSKLDAGVERLRIRVEVSERPAATDAEGDPNELKELEYEPPSAGKPGRGSFSLNSGRRVTGWVYVE